MLLLHCGRGRIVLWGDLAAVLCRGLKDARPPFGGWLPGDLVSPGSVVGGTRGTRFLRLVERAIPQLAAYQGLPWLGTRVRNPARPTSHRICDIARYSATSRRRV